MIKNLKRDFVNFDQMFSDTNINYVRDEDGLIFKHVGHENGR